LNKYRIEQIFEYLNSTIVPKSDLEYSTNFQLLIAVILSAQATDVGVNKVTRDLFPIANTPQKILDLGYEKFENLIKRIGLYRSKAQNIFKTCQIIIDKHGGEIPRTRDELEALHGVGSKTASVVLNIAFGELTIAVDTHVFRVSNRMGLVNTTAPDKTEVELLKIVPKKYLKHAHHLLILHGRYTCTARSPKCSACGVVKHCEFSEKTID
jgi:endonuclease-3